MSLLSSLPAPKNTQSLSRWEQDDDESLALVAAPAAPEQSALGKKDGTKAEFWQVVPKGPDVAANPHPDRDAVEEAKASTMEALSRVVDSKLTAANPKALSSTVKPGGPSYIKYTPQQSSRHHNSGVEHRVIQMQEMPTDPLEPPKFRHQKVPKVPDTTPVPVLHSPPRPVTKEDQINWKIPPCVSAWKNNKGYTIPLDKRLAADGRGMQEETINKKHMGLAHALYAAEETARKETELQARLQYEIKQREKQKKEAQLRELASQARMGGAAAAAAMPSSMASRRDDAEEDLPPPPPGPPPRGAPEADGDYPPPPGPPSRGDRGERLSDAEYAEKKKRDELRKERARERERELRLEEKNKSGAKRSKLTRDRDRDVSEKMALGQADVSRSREVQYDSRLFGRDSGISSGFGGDDTYNFYDKELFADRSVMAMYRGTTGRDADVYGGAAEGSAEGSGAARRFAPDKGFTGTEGGAGGGGGRSGPVQFEAAAGRDRGRGGRGDRGRDRGEKEADPFGIDSFLGDVAKR